LSSIDTLQANGCLLDFGLISDQDLQSHLVCRRSEDPAEIESHEENARVRVRANEIAAAAEHAQANG
jgi:hypothetical protein